MGEKEKITELDQLLALNVNEFTEKKKGMTYLSWAMAWREFIKVYPDATYNIIKNEQGVPYFGYDKIGFMTYTNVTAGGIEREMWLPVINGANKAMKSEPYKYKTRSGEKSVEAMSMFDVNKTVMRCLTKNLAMFGLGLYIYTGDDLPEQPPLEPQKPQFNTGSDKQWERACEAYRRDGNFDTVEKHVTISEETKKKIIGECENDTI